MSGGVGGINGLPPLSTSASDLAGVQGVGGGGTAASGASGLNAKGAGSNPIASAQESAKELESRTAAGEIRTAAQEKFADASAEQKERTDRATADAKARENNSQLMTQIASATSKANYS